MDFKKLLAMMSVIYGMGLVGCGSQFGGSDDEDNYNIGNPTKSVAALNTPDEGESQNLVLFDKTVRRIHQFDLTGMKHIRSFAVRNPQDEHFVLYGNNGNYIIDLSLKGLSIFNKYNQVVHQPIKFQGTPKSAAFLPSKGIVVVYDDLMSVGMMKVDANGEVLKKWVGGSLVAGISSISAGDLNADGKLILALSNGSIVVVDVEQCMDNQSWGTLTSFATGLTDIKWLAPLSLTPHQVLVRSSSKVALIDINAQTVLSSYDIPGRVLKISKFNDPHVILENGSKIEIVYAQGSQVLSRTYIPHVKTDAMYYLLSSNLDLVKDTWSFVDSTEPVSYLFNDLDGTQKSRRFVRNRFSDFLATHNKEISNDTQVELANGFIFALYPSELGYAVRYDVDSDAKSELKLFNLKYIPAD